MAADESKVKRVSRIARLELSDRELDEMEKDMESVLEAFRDLEKADTKNAKPAFQPLEAKNKVRKDKVEPSLSQEKALANTKNKEKGYFKGPRAV